MSTLSRSSFVALTAGGVAAGLAPSRAGAQSSKVRLGGINADLFAEPLYGKQGGIFEHAGFDAEYVALTNGGAVTAALSGGAIDLGVSDLVTGVLAINAGLPIVLLAAGALYLTSDTNLFVAVTADSPIENPHNLLGKTVGVPTLVGQTTIAIQAWLASYGLAKGSVKLVEIPFSAMFAAMQRGVIDAGLLAEPALVMVRSQVRDIGHPYDQISKMYALSVWYAARDWVDADRARAKRMVNAIYDTARWSNAHRTETLQILAQASKLDPSRVKDMARCTYATYLTPALVQPVFNIAAQYKLIDKPVDAAALVTRL